MKSSSTTFFTGVATWMAS